jgi:hypothetical protein
MHWLPISWRHGDDEKHGNSRVTVVPVSAIGSVQPKRHGNEGGRIGSVQSSQSRTGRFEPRES